MKEEVALLAAGPTLFAFTIAVKWCRETRVPNGTIQIERKTKESGADGPTVWQVGRRLGPPLLAARDDDLSI